MNRRFIKGLQYENSTYGGGEEDKNSKPRDCSSDISNKNPSDLSKVRVVVPKRVVQNTNLFAPKIRVLPPSRELPPAEIQDYSGLPPALRPNYKKSSTEASRALELALEVA